MRPLDKGDCPTDEHGNKKVVTGYAAWRLDLISRIGYYCAYCNMPLSHSIQVEHVIAKKPMPGLMAGSMLDWVNMLLGCGPCNLEKANQPVFPHTHYLPEAHNTLLAFDIAAHSTQDDSAIVKPAPGLLKAQQEKAAATIKLLGLDKIDRRQKVVDIRWKRRRDAMIAVELSQKLFLQATHSPTYDPAAAARCIAEIAKQTGFFLLWFKVFADQPSVMEKLLDHNIIPGTAQNCFDKTNGYALLPRNPGNHADPF